LRHDGNVKRQPDNPPLEEVEIILLSPEAQKQIAAAILDPPAPNAELQ
jgi:hypothetical protein